MTDDLGGGLLLLLMLAAILYRAHRPFPKVIDDLIYGRENE